MIKVELIESIGNDEELIDNEFNKSIMFSTNLKKDENLIKYISLGMDDARLKFLIEAPIHVAFELSKYQTGLVWNDVVTDIDSPKWYWSGTLMAFARVCNLRCAEDTQWETRQIANKIDYFGLQHFEYSWKELRKMT